VDEGLEAELRHDMLNGADVIEGVFASKHHSLHAKISKDCCRSGVVYGHLSGAVNLEARVQQPNQSNQPNVLHNHGVDATINRFTKKLEGIGKLVTLYEHIESEINPARARVSQRSCFRELIQGELGTLVSGIESLNAEINRVGAIRDSGSYGIE
jgi:hypothetical protein